MLRLQQNHIQDIKQTEAVYKRNIIKTLLLEKKYKDNPTRKKLVEKEVHLLTKKLDQLYLKYPFLYTQHTQSKKAK